MRTHRRTIQVEWGDCDGAEIVYYPNYFRWFDGSTHALLRSLGLGMDDIRRRYGVIGTPLVDARASFGIASAYGDLLDCEAAVAEWGRSSFKVHHRLLKGGSLAVEGWETRVWAAPDPGRPGGIRAVPIPSDVIRLFEGEG